MLEKLKTSLNISLLFIFVVALVVVIISSVSRWINPPKVNEGIVFTSEKIQEYILEKNVVKNYNTYFTFESMEKKLISSLHNGEYDKVYEILSSNLKEKIGKDKKELAQYYEQNFKYSYEEKDGKVSLIGYNFANNLSKLYMVDEKTYICVVSSINEKSKTEIAFRILADNTYIITYIEI